MAKLTSVLSHPPHPYYPLEVEIVGYLANEQSVPMLLGLFGGTVLGIFAVTLLIVRLAHPNLQSTEKTTILWFVLCKSSLPSMV
jgi:cholestenol delta-isomerase